MPWWMFSGLNVPVVQYAIQLRTEQFVESVLDGQYEHTGYFCPQLHKIVPKLQEKVIAAGTHFERVNEVDKEFDEYRFYRRLEKLYNTKLSKSGKITIRLIHRAQDFHDIDDDDKALACYNLALAYLPFDRIFELANHIHMGRARLLYTFQDYEGYADDAETSLGLSGILDDSIYQEVTKFRRRHQQAISDKEKRPDIVIRKAYMKNVMLNIKFGESEKIPVAANYITILNETDKGRFLITSKDIEPGTTVIVEDPYVITLDKAVNWRWRNCFRCVKAILQAYPCPMCTFAMYCSEACVVKDLVEGHAFECSCMNFMHVMGFDYFEILALKAICKAGPDDLFELFKKEKQEKAPAAKNDAESSQPCKTQKSRVVIPGFDPETDIYNSKSYVTIHNLDTHELTDAPILTALTWISIAVTKILEEKTNFFYRIGESVKDEFRRFVASLLLRNFISFRYNAFTLRRPKLASHLSYCYKELDTNEFMISGIYPLLSLLNHSTTDPNLLLVQMPGSRGKLVAIAQRQIRSGEELTISYGWTHDSMNLPRRASVIKKCYKIPKCKCFACVYKWPAAIPDPDPAPGAPKPPTKHLCPNCARNDTLSLAFRFQNCYIIRNGRHSGKCCVCSHVVLMRDLAQYTNTCIIMNQVARQHLEEGKPIRAIPMILQTIKYFQARLASPNEYILESQILLEQAYSKITEQ